MALTLTDGARGATETIVCTPWHPFYVADRGFVLAGELGVGTQIVTRAGPTLTVAATERCDESAAPVTVYNLTVDGDHTYFVGGVDGGAWVHNSCHYEVGSFGQLNSTNDGLVLHHVPQSALAQRLGVPGYTHANGPAIALTAAEHAPISARQAANWLERSAMDSAELLNDDIQMLQELVPGVPQEAIDALLAMGSAAGFK